MPHSSSHAGAFLMLGGGVDHLVEERGRLLERRPFGRDVAVVEAVERDPELGEELERGVHLLVGGRDRVGGRRERRVPWPVEGAGAEDVEPVPVEGMPVADGEAEVILHPSPGNDPVGVVPAERERVVAVRSLVTDRLADLGEELGHLYLPRSVI